MVFLGREAAGPVFWSGVLAVARGKEESEFEEEETKDLEVSGWLKLEELFLGSGEGEVGGVEEGNVVKLESEIREVSEELDFWESRESLEARFEK